MRDMHRDMRSCVIVNGVPSNPFQQGLLGVRQGSVLSPLLFSVFISGVIDEWKTAGLGVTIAGHKVGGLLFSDDIVLIAESVSELHRAMAMMDDHARRWRYKFNAAKCAVVAVGKQKPTEEAWTLQGQAIEEKVEYKYLGIQFQNTLRWTQWNEARTTKGKACLPTLWWCGAHHGALSITTGVKIVEMLMWPAMAYGGELAVVNKTMRRRAETAQKAAARQLTGTPHTTNTDFLSGELGWISPEAKRHISALLYLHRLEDEGQTTR